MFIVNCIVCKTIEAYSSFRGGMHHDSGHKLLRFSSKVSGVIAKTRVEQYIHTVTRVA